MAFRWIASEVASLRNYLASYTVLVKSLEGIAVDKTFKKPQRDKAGRLLRIIKNRSLMSYVHFYMDLSTQAVEWSEFSQRRNSLLIEQLEFKNGFTGVLLGLKSEYGIHFNTFLEEVTCKMEDGTVYGKVFPYPHRPCTESLYYAAAVVTWNGIELESMVAKGQEEDSVLNKKSATEDEEYDDDYLPGTEVQDIVEQGETSTLDGQGVTLKGAKLLSMKVVEVKGEILETLLERVEHYFPHESLDSFAIFDNKNFPTDNDELPNYGEVEVRQDGIKIYSSGSTLIKLSFNSDSDEWS